MNMEGAVVGETLRYSGTLVSNLKSCLWVLWKCCNVPYLGSGLLGENLLTLASSTNGSSKGKTTPLNCQEKYRETYRVAYFTLPATCISQVQFHCWPVKPGSYTRAADIAQQLVWTLAWSPPVCLGPKSCGGENRSIASPDAYYTGTLREPESFLCMLSLGVPYVYQTDQTAVERNSNHVFLLGLRKDEMEQSIWHCENALIRPISSNATLQHPTESE